MALLAGVLNTCAASPKSLLRQQPTQIAKCLQRDSRLAELHVGTRGGTEHPRGDDDDDAGLDLYVHDFAVDALLAVLPPDPTAVQRVPAIEDFNFLPDMGRMTWRLPWEERHGSSPAANSPANALPSS